MSKILRNTISFFGVAFIFLLAINALTQTKTVEVAPSNFICDLTGVDLTTNIVRITARERWEYYKEQLYTPQDFAKGISAQPSAFEPKDEFATQYGTYRLVLRLPEGKTYGLAMSSLDYSQRLFINGAEQEPVGVVGSSRASTTPKTTFCSFYFTPDDEQIELVIQYANFNHKSGGMKYPVYISEYQNIERRNQSNLIKACVPIGCMLTIFLFYLGMFLFIDRKRYYFHFAICCLCIGLRAMLVGEKVIMILLPNLNWFASIGMEYLTLILAILSYCVYLASIFPKLMHRFALYYLYLLSAAYTLIILFTSPVFYSKLLLTYQVGAYLAGGYMMLQLGRNIRNSGIENVMTFLAGLIFFLGAISDTLYHSRLTPYNIGGLTQLTMLTYIFANMFVLAVQFSRTEKEIATTRRKEQDHIKRIALLDHLNKFKTEFLANISHELKTPLTVVSGYAQLSGKQIEQYDQDLGREVKSNLRFITSEVDRLVLMVEQLLDLSRIEEDRMKLDIKPASVTEIIINTVQMYFPILNKNENTLRLALPSDLPSVYADAAKITQVLVNLITNAIRHTSEGEITIQTESIDDAFVKISVADTGSGIEPDDIEKIFDRNYTKAGVESSVGNGLGLYISKHIIDAHGGKTELKSVPGQGTVIAFTLPAVGNQPPSITKQ